MSLEQAALIASAVSAGALVLATAWIAIATLRGVQAQMHVQTFTEYTRRYSDIADSLPADFASPSCTTDPTAMPPEGRAALLRAMRRYFNLCWEELHLRRAGKIDGRTWTIWEAGVRDTMRSPCVRACWSMLRDEYDYGGLGREFVQFIGEAQGPMSARQPVGSPTQGPEQTREPSPGAPGSSD